MLFSVTEEDISDHPQFREMKDINPVVYPDYIRHALRSHVFARTRSTVLSDDDEVVAATIDNGLPSLRYSYTLGRQPRVRAQDRCITLIFLPSINTLSTVGEAGHQLDV